MHSQGVRLFVFFVLLIIAIPITVFGCTSSNGYKKVKLYREGETSKAPTVRYTKAPLRVAIAAVVSPKETFKSYEEFLAYLSKKLDRPVELIQRQTYGEVNELVRSGNVDLALVCTKAFVDGEREFGMEAIAVPEVRGEIVYYSYIIVPKDSSAQSLADLKGTRFAFTDPLSNSGRLSPVYTLWEMGETPESFFKQSVLTYSHDKSIRAVAEKLVDGAAVDSLVYEYAIARSPLHASQTKVILISPPYGSPPVVVHPSLAPQKKEQLKTVLYNMHQDEEGRKILESLMIDRFVPPDDNTYDVVREMSDKVGR